MFSWTFFIHPRSKIRFLTGLTWVRENSPLPLLERAYLFKRQGLEGACLYG